MNDLDMYKELIGQKASVEIAGTHYHGKIKNIDASKGEVLYELDVPLMGIFFVKPSEITTK